MTSKPNNHCPRGTMAEFTCEPTAGYGLDTRLYHLAHKRGWKMPINDVSPAHTWNRYWQIMEMYEAGEIKGRPIPPHRSG